MERFFLLPHSSIFHPSMKNAGIFFHFTPGKTLRFLSHQIVMCIQWMPRKKLQNFSRITYGHFISLHLIHHEFFWACPKDLRPCIGTEQSGSMKELFSK